MVYITYLLHDQLQCSQ